MYSSHNDKMYPIHAVARQMWMWEREGWREAVMRMWKRRRAHTCVREQAREQSSTTSASAKLPASWTPPLVRIYWFTLQNSPHLPYNKHLISFWRKLNIAPKRGFTIGFTKLSTPSFIQISPLPPPHKMTSRLSDSSHLSPSRMHSKLNISSTGTLTAVGDNVMSPCQCNPVIGSMPPTTAASLSGCCRRMRLILSKPSLPYGKTSRPQSPH